MKIEINIRNRQLAFLAIFISLIVAIGMTTAYNDPPIGGNPTIVGHSVDELKLDPLYINPATGNVGIGTTTPSAKLHIGGSAGVDGIMFPDGTLQTTAAGMPAGSVISYMGTIAPNGWLECNGASLLTDDYPALFGAIGYMYGGSGNSFNLPDLRGYFLRGWDNGAGIDPDAALRTDRGDGTTGDNVGTEQADAFRNHRHRYYGDDDFSGTGNIGNVTGGGSSNDYSFWTGYTGGSETRPKNIYVMYIINTN